MKAGQQTFIMDDLIGWSNRKQRGTAHFGRGVSQPACYGFQEIHAGLQRELNGAKASGGKRRLQPHAYKLPRRAHRFGGLGLSKEGGTQLQAGGLYVGVAGFDRCAQETRAPRHEAFRWRHLDGRDRKPPRR
jgi:hypothetical protein